jgi:hypothetical protein
MGKHKRAVGIIGFQTRRYSTQGRAFLPEERRARMEEDTRFYIQVVTLIMVIALFLLEVAQHL